MCPTPAARVRVCNHGSNGDEERKSKAMKVAMKTARKAVADDKPGKNGADEDSQDAAKT